MKIAEPDYCIQYHEANATVDFQGSLLLNGAEEYLPIVQLLLNAAAQQPVLTLDIQRLQMLNSSGFQMLSRFVIKVRQNQAIKLLIKGNKQISWQTKSLQNLQRLMPAIVIDFS